jgi:zinc protease
MRGARILPLVLLTVAVSQPALSQSALSQSAPSQPALLQGATPAPGAGTQAEKLPIVLLQSPASPLVSIRLMFDAGSIYDPPGKEGLSALTALMIGRAGTSRRTYAGLIEAQYPMAARINVSTQREVVVFDAQVHWETLADFTTLLGEVVLEPGFREDDFARNREQLLAFLATTLRSASDELLGLELLQQQVFRNHPYGHSDAGTVRGLNAITLEDVRDFYRTRYTRATLIAGVGGGYPSGFDQTLRRRLAALPAGTAARRELPAPAPIEGRRFTLVDKRTGSVGIHLGYPLPLTRKDADFYPLFVANSYLGEHRTFHGRLMQQLRGERGLNYGDYSYIEYWDNPPGTSNPTPNTPRRQQYFSVWVRPVVPDNAVFALRAALFEVDRLIARGLTEEEFVLTRDFLVSYSKLWARSLPDRLAFHMDSRYYGMPYFIDHLEEQLGRLTAADVNRAVQKYLQTRNFEAVMITGDAEGLRERLMDGAPSPIAYANPGSEEVTATDREIAALPIGPKDVRVVPVAETFER